MGTHIPGFSPPPDAEAQWKQFEEFVRNQASDFFDAVGPIAGARAPGRLDVMGGVADYSGSTVLEMPIAQAASVAWQWRQDRLLRIRSVGGATEDLFPEVIVSLDELVDDNGQIRPVAEVSARLLRDLDTRWSAYIAGCYYVMLAAYGTVSQGKADSRLGELGANILVHSDVPAGAGVSSSAAIEVATMHALSEAAGIHPSDLTLAAWCQRVENTIVNAPCGIMDQVTCALGRESALLVLRCQPHDLLGNQQIPSGWRFVGIDSRVKHSVGGSHYTKARVGAFMGLKIIQLESGGKLLENYLCNMTPEEFVDFRELIPETLTGEEYTNEYGLLPDIITRVDLNETYHPRACAEHPILENDRVRQFFGLMQIATIRDDERAAGGQDGESDDSLLREAGKLMYESHASYSDRLDLGSPETDLLVSMVREQGPEKGLYGAKITGGGSGGTVVVLCRSDSPDVEAVLEQICRAYEKRAGITPRPIVGSSPGAIQFGARPIFRG